MWNTDHFTLLYKDVGVDPGTGICGAGNGQELTWGPLFYTTSDCVDCTAPEKNLGSPSCDSNAGCGNPINVSVGNKYQRTDDVFLSSLLSFSRHYNSGSGASGSSLGPHWTHTYSRDLHSIKDLSGNIRYVVSSRPSGEKVTFKETAGVWSTDTDTPITLIKNVGSSGELLGWTYTFRDKQQVEEYDSLGRLIKITGRNEDQVTLTYNNGVVQGNSNDYLLTKAQDHLGRYLDSSYSSTGLLESITESNGNTFLYTYDASGRLATAGYPGGTVQQYHYNESANTGGTDLPFALTGITDESAGRYATFKYQADGRAVSTEHAGATNKFSVQYNSDGSADVIGPGGATQVRSFAVLKGVKKATSIVEQCTGCMTRTSLFSFDSNGRWNVATDAAGATTDYDYNTRGLLTQKVDAANSSTTKRKTQTDWHVDFPSPVERRTYNSANTLVAKSTYTYNTRGQALTASQIDPVSGVVRTTTTTYCESSDITTGTCPLVGLVTSVNGPRTDVGDTTTYTYRMADEASCATAPTNCPYRKGDLWKVTNALGQITETLAFDGAGRVLSVKDANGVITDMTYHPRGWLTARKVRGANAAVETDDAITAIEYWPTGLVKKVIQPDGAFTSYAYDAAHRLTDIADNAGNTIHYTLDNAGNRTQEDTKDPGNVLKRTLSRVYNQLGQLQTQADAQANPTDFTYDANGNTDTVTDALDRVTNNDYDPLNRLSRTLQDVGGINAQTQFQYDAQDNLTQVTDPKGLNTTYAYNGLGDLTQLVSPDTGTTAYTYDSAGNRATQTDARGQTSTYSYDVLNRLTGIAYATTALNVGYTYDTPEAVCQSGETFSTGRLTQLTDASGTTQYCYDRFGNLVRKVQTTNGVALTVRYAYTLAGQLSSVTYPDGAVATYTRDAQGRTTQVNVQRAGAASEVLLNQASYHPFGPVAGWTYGNGRQLLRPLNQNYQPTAIHDASTGGLSVGFQYDPVGNLTQLTPAASATPLVKFDYDALSRLTKFKDGPTDVAIESYAYDATGNRQSFTNSAGTQAYSYPSTNHRLSQVGTTARSYDNAGNTTAIGGIAKEFVYDDTGRMAQVKQNAIVQRNYAYNGKGEQVREYAGTANTYTLYDEAGHWLGDYDNTGAALQQAIWLDDLPVGLIANGNQLHYIEPDHLGTPRVVIEVARNVPVWTWDLKSEAFGNSVPAQDPDGDATPLVFDMRFPGQRFDAATGLNQNGARDYDMGGGRYVQSDPIGLNGGISTYAYALNSPLTWIDPEGTQMRGAVNPTTTLPPGTTGAYNPVDPNNVSGEVLPPSSIDWPEASAPEVSADGLLETLFKMSPLNAISQIEQAISNKLNNVCESSEEREKNCQALKDSILSTCASLTGRKKFKCFEAANKSYRQCMGYE
ncbi:RHS repeat-associated core domain-containing protein [Pseudoxanthomonas sp. CF125]|nr:RHS repeat-associated core domain-containing protein [Pseudoxanthomonas sp. CF125]